MRGAGPVAALALDVLIARVVGRGEADLPLRGVAPFRDRMALRAGLRGIRAESVEGVRVSCLLPAALLADVTVAAYGEIDRGFVETESASRCGRRILEERPLDLDDRLIRTGDEEEPDRNEEKTGGAGRVMGCFSITLSTPSPVNLLKRIF